MFTGIIKEVGTIQDVRQDGGGRRITITSNLAGQLAVDQSINLNGVCHTVVETDGQTFTVQSVDETLRTTNLGELRKDDKINLEPSLHSKQLLDGHLVQGHVDANGKIEVIEKENSDHLFIISFPEKFNDLVVGRGSIAIDGISLTIAEVRQNEFTVAVIPFTYEHSIMQYCQVGDSVNLEFDIFGKYVVRYLENRA